MEDYSHINNSMSAVALSSLTTLSGMSYSLQFLHGNQRHNLKKKKSKQTK